MHRVSNAALDELKSVWEEWQKGENEIRHIEDFVRGYLFKAVPKENFQDAFNYVMLEIEVWEAGWEE